MKTNTLLNIMIWMIVFANFLNVMDMFSTEIALKIPHLYETNEYADDMFNMGYKKQFYFNKIAVLLFYSTTIILLFKLAKLHRVKMFDFVSFKFMILFFILAFAWFNIVYLNVVFMNFYYILS